MANVRKYGQAPFRVAVVHGGPGAPGEMAPVARELSSTVGVLEPLQTVNTVEGQVQELRDILQKEGHPPMTLIGFSWGAWLAYLVAARYPSLVEKLVLIGSPPFEEKYAREITVTRLGRLGENERNEAQTLLAVMNAGTLDASKFARFGELTNKADAFDTLPGGISPDVDFSVYQNVWQEASKLRERGQLLRYDKKIRCPVVAIHGDYDPHPAAGVREPLARVIKDFRFLLLTKCGHRPWLERNARDAFYRLIMREIQR